MWECVRSRIPVASLVIAAGCACGNAQNPPTDASLAPSGASGDLLPSDMRSDAPPPGTPAAAGGESGSGSTAVPSDAASTARGAACANGVDLLGEVTAHVQADIDRLAGCETIEGSLRISFTEALDLRPLSALRAITGTLFLAPLRDISESPYGPRLASLQGLEGLRTVDALVVVGVETGLDPLAGLSGDVAQVILADIAGARDLSALGGITITSQFSVDTLPALESLDGVSLAPGLEFVQVWETPRLTTLSGLDGLVNLGVLWLRNVATLGVLSLPDGLVSLEHVFIDGLPELITLAELSRFSTTIRSLQVANAPRLGDLGGGSANTGSLTELGVSSCPALRAIDPVGGMSSLTTVSIDDCDGVTELDGLGVSDALQSLSISGNAALTHLPAFERAPAQMVSVHINDNTSLVQGASFPNLSTLYDFETPFHASAELQVVGNPVLTSIGEYPSLESATMIALDDNLALTTLSIPSLRSLDWLRLRGNRELAQVDLDLLDPLSVVELVDNPKLERLTLGAISDPLSRLELRGNPALTSEDRQSLLDRIGEYTETTLE